MSETVIPYNESGMDDPMRAVVFEAWIAGTLGPRSPFYRTDPPPSYENAWEAREAARADSGNVDVSGLLTRAQLGEQLGLTKTTIGHLLRNYAIEPAAVVGKTGYYSPEAIETLAARPQREAVTA